MQRRPRFRVDAVALLAVVGCGDLRLADRLNEATTSARGGNTTGTSGAPQQSGGQSGIALGGSSQAGQTSPGGGSISTNGGTAGGSAIELGGATAMGGATNTFGGTPAMGGATNTLGGAAPATGGSSTGGAPVSSAGASAVGGTATGGRATGGAATGGSLPASAGTTATGGVTIGGNSTGGKATGGIAGTASSAGSAGTPVSPCPSPISKPVALLAAEPTPADRCARVSNVVRLDTSNYAYGYTNGELYVRNPTSGSQTRADIYGMGSSSYTLPRSIVTTMVAPMANYEGSIYVGYADPQGTNHNPWWTAALGRGWYESTVEQPGTVMTLTGCPFHGGVLSHLEMAIPWLRQGSLTSGSAYTAQNADKLNQHLLLANTSRVTAVEVVTKSNGWLVYAGTDGGEIYVSNLLVGAVTWNDTTSTLSSTVTWTKITGAAMPKVWITRLAVHPAHPERIFAVFFDISGNAVFYSEDEGTTWSNRQANLPKATNLANKAPPVLGISFNPTYEGAAYAVTSLTSYYTLDYGVNWTEW